MIGVAIFSSFDLIFVNFRKDFPLESEHKNVKQMLNQTWLKRMQIARHNTASVSYIQQYSTISFTYESSFTRQKVILAL